MRFYTLMIVVALFWVERGFGQTFNVGANFQTAAGNQSGFVPPDTSGAAGQNQIVVLNNGIYTVFNKLGTQQQSMNDTTFFSRAGYSGTGGNAVAGDPRVRFDPLTGRWFALEFTGASSNNRMVIAVSAGADATATAAGNQWKSTFFTTSLGQFGDFPTLGIDKNGLYIGTNNFTSTYQGSSLFTLTKSGLLWSGAGSPTITSFTNFEPLGVSNGATPHATTNFDVNQSGNTNRAFGNPRTGPDGGTTGYRTYLIQNTNGTTTLGSTSLVSVGTNSSPSSVPQSGGNNVQANDNRISGQVIQMGNFIYFANSFDNGTGRSQARFTVVNATTGALVQTGAINSLTLSYFFPTIAVNESGQAVMGFSGGSSGTTLSAYAVVGAINQVTGMITWGSVQQVSAGASVYTGFGPSSNDGPPYRWGDYSMVSVAPADTGVFWSMQERAGTSTDGFNSSFSGPGNLGNWATQATEIIPDVAGQVRWLAAANGNYASAGSWFNGVAPGATDHAIYSRNGAAFTVTLPAGTTSNDRISVRQGNVTFNIPSGATYQATNTSSTTPSFAVSQMLGDSTVTITGGGTFSTVYTTLAAGENGLGDANNISKATVTVTGAGTTWTNSRDVYFGGSATRSGGAATLNVNSGALVTIGEVARFWTSTSGVNLNNGTTLNVGGLRADSGVTPTITGAGGATLNITDGLGQTYFGAINGSLAIIKTGAGTQTLSGSMNYSGTTDINAGRLNINGTKSGTGAVNVANGAVLGGSGSVAGVVTINNGATIAPGQSAGNLTLTGGVSMSAGTYQWELAALTTSGPGNNYDEITINGGASTIGGTSQVELAFIGTALSPNTSDPFWQTSHQWLITDLVSGSLSGIYSGITNPNYTSGIFFLSGGNGDIFLNFAPVPEPGTLAIVGTVLAGFVVLRRRKKS